MGNLVANKYILYARKSTESDDKQAASIESQLNEMLPIAKERGINIVETIQESCSGYKTGRKGFKLLIEKVSKGEVDGIICWSLSRLARNALDAGQLIQYLQTGKIGHIVTYKKDYYPNDSSILLYVEFGINNQYSQDLSEDTLRGLRQKALRGWNPQATLPLGYMHNPNEKLRKFSDEEIIKEPERFELVKMFFRDILDNGLTTADAIKKAIDLGLTTRKGKVPSHSVMYRILKNPFYYGEFEYPKGEKHMGKHPRMLTKEEYMYLDRILHKRYPYKVSTHEHKYTGLLRCSNCNCAITAEPVKTKVLKNLYTKCYKYYRCTHKKGNCGGRYAKEEEIETQIIADLKRFFLPSEIIEIIKNEIESQSEIALTNTLKKSDSRALKVSKLEQKRDRLLDLYVDGKLSDEEYNKKKGEINSEINTIPEIKDEVNKEKYKNQLPNIEMQKYKDLDIKVRKKLLMDVYEKMSYYNGNFKLEHYDTLDVFYNVPSEITNDYYKVRTNKNVDMKEFIQVKVRENATWGG